MSNSKGQVLSIKVVMLALIAFLVLPITTLGQYPQNDQGRERGDDRQDRRGDYRQDRRDDDRQDRREDRWQRREARRGNNRDGYPNWGGSFQLRQTALNAGYNEGMREGRRDSQKRERFDFRDEKTYQRATNDYSSKLGSKELYQRYLRAAFENGYNDGYYGYN